MGQHKHKTGSGGGKTSPNKSRNVATTVVILLVVAAVIGIDVKQRNNRPALANFVPQRTKGEANAPIKIVEFVDFQCSHCKDGMKKLKELMAAHPKDILLTLKYYPLGQLNSSMSAYYAECAGHQGKFWEMADRLFETQDEWRTLLKIKPSFDKLASEVGLDPQKMAECVESKSVKKIVSSDLAIGEANQVRSTPTYFINGEMTVGVFSMEKAVADILGKEKTTSN